MRAKWSSFVSVPTTWEGWAVRVLTVAVVLVIGIQAVLGAQLLKLIALTEDQNVFMNNSVNQRTAFQHEETARQCELLRHQNVTLTQLQSLGC